MILSQQEQKLIQASFAKIAHEKELAGRLFYERLFTLDPNLRAMFQRGPIETQAEKLMQVIEWVVNRVDRVEEIDTELQELGSKHKDYGVTTDHYAQVGAALLWTLNQSLGGQMDNDTEAAWIELYTYLSGKMDA